MDSFIVRGDRIPVTDKAGPRDMFGGDVEPASTRFQKNMAWLTAMRACLRLVQAYEVKEDMFFDIVVRLRDDSFALQPWLIDPVIYRHRLVSLNLNTNFGINDHNFAIDGYWSDAVMRGVTEDYYFNSTLDIFSWVNPERRIYKVAASNGVPIAAVPFCHHPLVPLRGEVDKYEKL